MMCWHSPQLSYWGRMTKQFGNPWSIASSTFVAQHFPLCRSPRMASGTQEKQFTPSLLNFFIYNPTFGPREGEVGLSLIWIFICHVLYRICFLLYIYIQNNRPMFFLRPCLYVCQYFPLSFRKLSHSVGGEEDLILPP